MSISLKMIVNCVAGISPSIIDWIHGNHIFLSIVDWKLINYVVLISAETCSRIKANVLLETPRKTGKYILNFQIEDYNNGSTF